MRYIRVLIGFVVAPAVPALLLFGFNVFRVDVGAAMEGAIIFMVVGYGSAALLGIPAHLVLQAKRIIGVNGYLFSGALIGVVYFGLIFVPIYLGAHDDYLGDIIGNTLGLGLAGCFGGMLSGYVFWLIAIRSHDWGRSV